MVGAGAGAVAATVVVAVAATVVVAVEEAFGPAWAMPSQCPARAKAAVMLKSSAMSSGVFSSLPLARSRHLSSLCSAARQSRSSSWFCSSFAYPFWQDPYLPCVFLLALVLLVAKCSGPAAIGGAALARPSGVRGAALVRPSGVRGAALARPSGSPRHSGPAAIGRTADALHPGARRHDASRGL